MHQSMDVNRRKLALQYYVEIVTQDTDREQKAFEGIKNMADVYQRQPSFSDADTRNEVDTRREHVTNKTFFYRS